MEDFTDPDYMDSPCECVSCGTVFDSEDSFVTKPYRAVCPECGQTQPIENDWKYYIEY